MDMKWRRQFTDLILLRGQEYFQDGLVKKFTRTDQGYEAFVTADRGQTVSIKLQNNELISMSCGCAYARSGKVCKHMAAVLFAAEADEHREMDRLVEEEMERERRRNMEAKSSGRYRYFQLDKLRRALDINQNKWKKALEMVLSGEVVLNELYMSFENYSDEPAGVASGFVNIAESRKQVRMVFTRDKILQSYCECPECSRYYGWSYGGKKSCIHLTALFKLVSDYIQEHDFGDATDRTGFMVLTTLQRRMMREKQAGRQTTPDSLLLEPRIRKKDGTLQLSFQTGQVGGRMYVVKGLSKFVSQMDNRETAEFGKTSRIPLNQDNLSDRGREYLEYIRRVSDEFQSYAYEFNSRYDYQNVPLLGQSIELSGTRLDEFYALIGMEEVDFEEEAGGVKLKSRLKTAEENPAVTLRIRRIEPGKSEDFEGLRVSAELPELYYGVKQAYFTAKGKLCRCTEDFLKNIMPLAADAVDGRVSFRVGRNNLSAFYYNVLPKLREFVEVVEEDMDIVEQYLPPEVQFCFYLDAEDGNITCRAAAVYGEREIVLAAEEPQSTAEPLDAFRDRYRESEAVMLLHSLFPYVETEKGEYHCDGREELVYRVLNEGVNELMDLGEVSSTNRFRSLNLARKSRVAVGVSMSSGLLNLEISSDDISREELLEILKSCRAKKKYHRLRNGDFLNLEEDHSYEALSELMDSLHLSPKEFIKGKMKLPAYRALYLDRMLEENEELYSSRDSHFKRLMKEFKAVSDSEFEEPAGLKRVLRNYQKTGYKWLRTLEAYGFGGILADDMGLGKTVQVIAVLLAAKDEGMSKPALIVTPASLVYNWEEEIKRFAPSLSVGLICGKQEERRSLLADEREYDVLITSYDLLKRDIAAYEELRFHYMIIDEAQFIKNQTTAAAKAVKLVHSTVRYALTGTPIENRLSELWSIFDFLMPGFLYHYEAFRKEFETRIVKNGDEAVSGRLRKMVSPFILRRLKENVLKDLPDKMEELRYARMEEEQQRIYDAQVVHMRQTLAGQDEADIRKNSLQILRELTRLRQICCDPSLCFENYAGGSAKLEACLDLVESAIEGGHRLLIFSQFTSMLELLEKNLVERSVPYCKITGATPKESRLQLVRRFNQDTTPVFLISLKAGGTGLNLIGADVVIHYDPWWNAAVQNQATDRAHRIGQTRVVTVYRMIAKGTIEEKIIKMQENKKDLAEQIISGGTNQLSGMTREDLLELLE